MTTLCIYILIFFKSIFLTQAHFEPTWESVQNRSIPHWFNEAKFGILIHWGLYTAQGIYSETFYEEWLVDKQQTVITYMKKYYPKNFEFMDLTSMFTCEFFDANQWAEIIKASKARYVIVTAKYNDGFPMWRSSLSPNWNSVDDGPMKNLVGDLATAIRKNTKAHFGLHYSLQDVFHPLYISDRKASFQKNDYTIKKLLPELKELVTKFTPEIIWIDGPTSSDAPYTYYNSTYFLAWLYNKSPTKDTVVVNDKWGRGTACKFGGYFSCSPPAHSHSKQNNAYKWESTFGINRYNYGHRPISFLQDYRTTEEIIEALVSTVSMGGNLLLTIGATKDGRIIPLVEERLKEIGQWLDIYGEAIFGSVPWKTNRDSTNRNIWYTCKTIEDKVVVYVFLLKWPVDNILRLQDPKVTKTTQINLLGFPNPLEFTVGVNGLGMVLELSPYLPIQITTTSWVFKIINLAK